MKGDKGEGDGLNNAITHVECLHNCLQATGPVTKTDQSQNLEIVLELNRLSWISELRRGWFTGIELVLNLTTWVYFL